MNEYIFLRNFQIVIIRPMDNSVIWDKTQIRLLKRKKLMIEKRR